MSLIGALGLKNAGLSIAQIIAQLVGRDLTVNSLTATSATTPLNAPNGPATVNNLIVNAAVTALDFASSTARITWGAGNFLVMHGGTGRVASSGGYASVNYALGSGGGVLMASSTAPTISSGFGAGAAIIANNGTFAFTLSTGAASATGVIGFPAATTGWAVAVQNLSSNTATIFLTKQTATTTTTATIGNYDAAGASQNWGVSDTLLVLAHAF